MGVKGLLYVELHAKVSEKDAHSMYAAIMPSAVWHLVEALNTLRDKTGKILIDGFYDGIQPISQAELDALKTDVFSEEDTKKNILGIEKFINDEHGEDLLKRLYYQPTCNICGITAGYQGAVSYTHLDVYKRQGKPARFQLFTDGRGVLIAVFIHPQSLMSTQQLHIFYAEPGLAIQKIIQGVVIVMDIQNRYPADIDKFHVQHLLTRRTAQRPRYCAGPPRGGLRNSGRR